MKTTKKTTTKKGYQAPQIERIVLDKDISLVLSSPAPPPDWSENRDSSNPDPFKTEMG